MTRPPSGWGLRPPSSPGLFKTAGRSWIRRTWAPSIPTSRPPSARAFSLPAYDATRLLIAAIGRAIDDAGGALPTRDQVLKQVSATRDYRGVMGATSFDARGDTKLKLLSAYQWLGANDAAGQFVAQPSIDG